MKHCQEMQGIVKLQCGEHDKKCSLLLFHLHLGHSMNKQTGWREYFLVIFLAPATLSLYSVQPDGGLHGELQLFGLIRLGDFFVLFFKHQAVMIVVK